MQHYPAGSRILATAIFENLTCSLRTSTVSARSCSEWNKGYVAKWNGTSLVFLSQNAMRALWDRKMGHFVGQP